MLFPKEKIKERGLSTTLISNVLKICFNWEILRGLPFYVGAYKSDGNLIDFWGFFGIWKTLD